MLCDNVYQLQAVLNRYDFHPSTSDLITVMCGKCDKTDVCPAGTQGQAESTEAELAND